MRKALRSWARVAFWALLVSMLTAPAGCYDPEDSGSGSRTRVGAFGSGKQNPGSAPAPAIPSGSGSVPIPDPVPAPGPGPGSGSGSGSSSGSGSAAAPPVGVNLEPVSYFARQWAFVDIVKSGNPWFSQPVQGGVWADDRPLSLTAGGCPASLAPGQAAAMYLCANDGHYPAGEYACLYAGSGTLEFLFDASVLDRQPGRVRFLATPESGGILVRITQTDPANPLRDIRIVPTAFEDSYLQQPFHPLFLQRLAPFKVLRFMDWQRTNLTKLSHWADRPTPADLIQSTDGGVAVEYMVDLCNAVGADPWFCIPHLATDDFVRSFATLVKQRLNPDRRAYLEYSNEVWNSYFPANAYTESQRIARGLPTSVHYYSERSVEIFRIWEQVFGGRGRLVRVMASHYHNPWVSEVALAWKNAWLEVDALAVAYYMRDFTSGDQALVTRTWTVDKLLDEQDRSIPEEAAWMVPHESLARTYGIQLVAYEGGQGLVQEAFHEFDPVLHALFLAANRHPRMYGSYHRLLDSWRQGGGGLFMQFAFTSIYDKFGFWGALEWQEQDLSEAHKYRALIEWR